MRRLSKDTFAVASQYILQNGRELEKSIYHYYFLGENSDGILSALKKYQNENGGFGHALEPDFCLPLSSPVATSIALQHLLKYGDDPKFRRRSIVWNEKANIKFMKSTAIDGYMMSWMQG